MFYDKSTHIFYNIVVVGFVAVYLWLNVSILHWTEDAHLLLITHTNTHKLNILVKIM